MAEYSTANLRTVALVGHGAAGKTTLAEMLLAKSKMIGAPGSVEKGNTVSDYDPLEKAALHSLRASVLHCDYNGTRIHLIDTPGYPDFVGQAIGALDAVETAVVVVSATAGIELMTRRMMQWAKDRNLCRLIVVNKIDHDNVDLPGLLARLQEAFGPEVLPINLPAGGGTRVIDCFDRDEGEADFWSVAEVHRKVMEQVVEVDDAAMEKYLEEGAVDPSTLHAPLEKALREGHLVPVCFVSARTGAGVQDLLDVMVRHLPNPAEGNPPLLFRGEQRFRAEPDPAKHVLAHVFKVVNDPYVGKIGVFRVHQGTVQKDTQLFIGDGKRAFKAGHLFLLQGKDTVEVARLLPGDIGAVAKVEDIAFDSVLHDSHDEDGIRMKPLEFPKPMYGLAVEPKRRGDEGRLSEVLAKMAAEDPTLAIEHDVAQNETVIRGLSELHLRTVLERMSAVYKLEVTTRPPRVPYRETIASAAEGHARHKKQTGGAGQFGEVFLRVEPLPRGAGFEFVDQVKGGVIPFNLIPAVEKGVREVLASGFVAGYPIQDIRVTVYDGKHHPVDSKEVAFVAAGRKAMLDALPKARPIVLEPIVAIQITAPDGAMGDISGDLSARRGQITGTDNLPGSMMVIKGLVPLAELDGYAGRLKAITQGQGSYTIELSHYEPVPPTVQQQLANEYRARRKAAEEED
ncbi:MAG: elongation factor G [Sutterellaceae bacterium]|nr:elongation factor G [Burkholderiaceae bacterium]MDW8429031.1 elongation factor G [Sutterellaceae bacterium]